MADLPAKRDPGPMARLRDMQADPDAMDEVYRLLCDGKSLRKIALELKLPRLKFIDWMMTDHADVIDRAERTIIHERMRRLMDLSEGLSAENVAAFKAEADFIIKVASKWDRPKYGEHVKVERTVDLNVDAGLLGKAAELLERLSPPKPKVIDVETVPVERQPI